MGAYSQAVGRWARAVKEADAADAADATTAIKNPKRRTNARDAVQEAWDEMERASPNPDDAEDAAAAEVKRQIDESTNDKPSDELLDAAAEFLRHT